MTTVTKNEKDTKAPATATGPATQERTQQANEARTLRLDAADALRVSIRKMEDLASRLRRDSDEDAADDLEVIVSKLCRLRDREWRRVNDALKGA